MLSLKFGFIGFLSMVLPLGIKDNQIEHIFVLSQSKFTNSFLNIIQTFSKIGEGYEKGREWTE